MIGNQYEYDTMAKCEQDLWWYRSLHDLTLSVIKANTVSNPKVLDAGCGTGGLLLQLKKNGYTNIAGFDFSSDAVNYARRTSGVDVQLLDITKAGNTYPPDSFDIVVSNDIVCLLEEGQDKVAVDGLLRILKPGGLLIMNLAALKIFSGTHDLAVDMQRRYSKKTIRAMVNSQGQIKQLQFWPFLLSPAIFGTRVLQKIKLLFIGRHRKMVSDVKMPPLFLNKIFYKVTKLENDGIRKKPWGSSLFVVVQKLQS
jgi:SAM-dependent methyltransferase